MCGIYTITNIINNKIYIGYTTNFSDRKYDHFGRLKKNNHPNERLQNSWNKYGEENFVFEILIEVSKDLLASEENYWCNLLNTHNKNYGFNISPTHPNGKMSYSLESKKKASISHKKKFAEGYKHPLLGKKWSLETRLKRIESQKT